MKVLPIKLPDEMYYDLKLAAKHEETTMADFIRMRISNPIKIAAGSLRKKRVKKEKLSFLELTKHLIYKGPGYNMDKTDDEILYGGKLGNY